MASSPQRMPGYSPQGASPPSQNKGLADALSGVSNGQPQSYGAPPVTDAINAAAYPGAAITPQGVPQGAPQGVPQYSAPPGSPMAPSTVNLPPNGQGGPLGVPNGMPPGQQPGGAYQMPWSPGPKGMR
jgi:hypothetical protein